ncbi:MULTISPECIES: hypothetical protein [Streptomyces]|uniref:hypothetical protein n=1 Tax=Streptomyces TaxID=1883 RepID=UPI0005DCE9C5|nr:MULTISPECIES: hypothetical protein [Streptomyces]PPA42126.1 hypothetical protein BF14_022005 [Streptomyces griseus]RAN19429.1 hypothetical protein A3838_21500 [Streptomyces badius]RAN27343.1 hypothetical protein A3800_21515 [Streptomyces badius]UIZ13146.1 hypothetical protein LZ559_12285 [Streptomyces sp. R527F]WSQ93888.1 hypothetical protein OG425_22130 [Streptomyces globisporus]
MAWDEWEQIKADVAAKGPASMQLNQAPSEGGTSGDLKSNRKTWVRVGEGVTDLKGGVGKALTKLADGQTGLGDTTGSVSAAAQKELYDSWKKYVSDVRGRCEALGGLLQKAGHDLSKTDEEALADLEKLQVKYEDTKPVGGQSKEK